MSNNNYSNVSFKPEDLIAGLTQTAVPLSQVGLVFKEKISILQSKVEDLIANTFGIEEIDHVFIYPDIERNGTICQIVCRAYFNTKGVTKGNIVRAGNGTATNNGQPTILSLMGSNVNQGGFDVSDDFKKKFAALQAQTDDKSNKLKIYGIKGNRDIAVLDLDFFAVMSVVLGIGSDSPYDYSVLSVSPIGSGNNPDYTILISKFIDAGNRNKGRRKNRNVDYTSLDREFSNKVSGGRNNNNGRSFR